MFKAALASGICAKWNTKERGVLCGVKRAIGAIKRRSELKKYPLL